METDRRPAVSAAVAGRDPALLPAAIRETLALFWDSPFPSLLQDARFRTLDVNAAFCEFSGHARETLLGGDIEQFLLPEDRTRHAESRKQMGTVAGRRAAPVLIEGRIVDARGFERWFRASRRVLEQGGTGPYYFSVLQDTTLEHAARERADRSVRELDDWFDLSPVGMVLFDESGLFVRTNPAFDEMAGAVPVSLAESTPSLAALLSWSADGPLAQLRPGSRPIESQGWVTQPDGRMRPLRAIVRCYRTANGERRYMGIVEDRSVEEERDLAQMQVGALMDTAGLGIATFEESSGWVRQNPVPGSTPSASTLHNISREIVMPESRAEYERLQTALKHTQRAEVRYAIEHPELGQRWLYTRVEPATLASGKKTASVVTLDITDQRQSQRRSEQLLREMTTILESTAAGIAYLRAGLLVRCNRRFETMLGLGAEGVAGSSVAELLAQHPHAETVAAGVAAALAVEATYEIEFEFDGEALADAGRDGDSAPGRRWYSLSVRRAGSGSSADEAIAVLSDVTRMKRQQVELERLARDRELMFSLSDVGIAYLRDGRIERANAALSNLTGWPVEELSSLSVNELFGEGEEHARRRDQEERELRLHGRSSGERQLRRRDGRLVWVQTALRPVDQADPSAGVIASYVDVDARHRAERAVALQAERTRSILDSALVGIVIVGANGIEWMNRSARRMFGGSIADFLDQPIATVATDEPDHPFRTPRVADDLEGHEAETFECRVRARDGREFWVVGNAVATGREGTGAQLTYALLDIERRRQAEAAVSQAQASLRHVIEAAPLAIVLLDAKTLAVVQVNEVAARSTRLGSAELVGMTPEQVFGPATGAVRRADMEAALRAGEVTSREYRLEVGGEIQVWDASYVPLRDARSSASSDVGQAPDQLLLVATDVSEQRAMQEARFDAAIAQREMLVKEVHHRIKNNLQGVAGLLQQIAERKPEVAGAIDEVVGQVHAIAQIYGLQVGSTGPLSVASVLEAIVGSVQRTFGHRLSCSVTGSEGGAWMLPEVEAIPIALTLNELLTNAVKHATPESRDEAVDCVLACGEHGVRVAISNRGRLAAGFSIARFPNGVSGLGLVRALLPRKSATLAIEQVGERVVATVTLRPPGVARAPE